MASCGSYLFCPCNQATFRGPASGNLAGQSHRLKQYGKPNHDAQDETLAKAGGRNEA